ncbi:MAG: hypothetical protein A2Z20_02070 [Bdellovibrionales bacterium RBG_16_40_8]|nr:MAG: hypothetical protein A2Z20_02070 [Bdellovibrionales bacterium RBG_16_40_8]
MNKSSALGFFIAFMVVYMGVLHNSPNPGLFLDTHALILVCGGTAAAALIGFPLPKLARLLDFILYKVIFDKSRKDTHIAKDMILAYRNPPQGKKFFEVSPKSHPFIVETSIMLEKTHLSPHELDKILTDRINYVKKSYLDDAKVLNSLAKFPPAFGLLGATTGMISMMIGLGSGGADQIGPAMAIALVATFWGIAIANLVLLPLSDHATKVATEEIHTRNMIKAAIQLMVDKKCSQERLVEVLIGYLPLKERREFKKYSKDIADVNVHESTEGDEITNLQISEMTEPGHEITQPGTEITQTGTGSFKRKSS